MNGSRGSKRQKPVARARTKPSRAAKKPAKKSPAKKRAVAKRTAPKRAVAKRAVAKRPVAKRAVAKRTAPKRTVAKRAAPKRAVAKRVVAKRTVAKRAAPKRTVAKRTVAKRVVAKRVVAKRAAAKRTVAKRAVAARPIEARVVAKVAPLPVALPKPVAPPRVVVVNDSALPKPLEPAPASSPVASADPPSSPHATGVRVGRLPPRGDHTAGPPPELGRPLAVRSAPRMARLAITPTLPRPPFRHEMWQSVESAARELDAGELTPDQRKAIRAALEGHDAVVSMPSGLARAASWVVPARMLNQPVLVVAARPLLLRELGDRLISRRVPVVRVDASTSESETKRALERVAQGGSLIVLATPNMLLGDDLPRALAQSGIALVVVDDAHVLSSWSDEVSPAALDLGASLARLGAPPTMALLAAAPPAVRHEVIDVLCLRSPVVVEGSPVRQNLSLDVVEARGEVRQRGLVQLALRLRRPGIIFAPTARDVDAIYSALSALRLPVHRFHQHMPPGERVGEQLNFFVPGRRSIMVATSAFASPSGVVGVGESALLDRAPNDFGLGIEKRDIRFVIHWAPPASLEQYARELALIGRDGDEATAVLFHDASERGKNESLLAEKRLPARHFGQLARALEPAAIDGRPRTVESLALASGLSRRLAEAIVAVLDDAGIIAHRAGWVQPSFGAPALGERVQRLAAALERQRSQDTRRLDAVIAYATGRGCFEQNLEQYFGEHSSEPCGRCGTCRGSVLPGFDDALPLEHAPARRPAVETFSIGRDDGYGLAVAAPARQVRPLMVKLGDFRSR